MKKLKFLATGLLLTAVSLNVQSQFTKVTNGVVYLIDYSNETAKVLGFDTHNCPNDPFNPCLFRVEENACDYLCYKVTSIDDDYGSNWNVNAVEVSIPNTITYIGKFAFSYSNIRLFRQGEMKNLVIGDSAFYQGASFVFGGSIPYGTISIGVGAFANNYRFDGYIPETVTHIGDYAFANTSSFFYVSPENPAYSSNDNVLYDKQMTTLIQCPTKKTGVCTIPESVIKIKEKSFSGCTGLTTIINLNPVPVVIHANVFEAVNKSKYILYVPFGSKTAYKNANVWKEFNIIELPLLTEITKTPTINGATIEWQPYENATGYRLIIYADAVHTQKLHIYEFNAAGQLVKETNLRAASTSFSYTVTGLNSGTGYFYALETLGVNSVVLESQSGSFTTLGSATGIHTATAEKTITGYYNIMGAKLKHEPQSGSYIVLYNDGSTEKRMRK